MSSRRSGLFIGGNGKNIIDSDGQFHAWSQLREETGSEPSGVIKERSESLLLDCPGLRGALGYMTQLPAVEQPHGIVFRSAPFSRRTCR